MKSATKKEATTALRMMILFVITAGRWEVIDMVMGLIGVAVGLFSGVLLGWTNGYDAAEKSNKRIESEMTDFWKEVEKNGL